MLQLCGTVTVYMALTQAPPKYSDWGNGPKQVYTFQNYDTFAGTNYYLINFHCMQTHH